MKKIIYSLWHSNRSRFEFLEIIEKIWFDYLVDVRSKPFSRFCPHFNIHWMKSQLWDKYIFMWDILGWMNENITEQEFEFWINKLSKLAKDHVVVFFCSEKYYTKCHRYYTITPELEIRWFKVIHL